MCGINGITWQDKKIVASMNKVIKHRGPDSNGIYEDSHVTLGHNRLSIIDLSKSANQPLYNEDKTIVLVYNGEIYNHKELKKELGNHSFSSNTDSEILIHGYEEWGIDALLEKCNGFFAFCIYDKRKKKIILVRDRIGIKPLYYSVIEKKLIFSSELKAIQHVKQEQKINYSSLEKNTTFRYIAGDKTIFEGINKLKPGTYLSYDLKTKKKQLKTYYAVKEKPLTKNTSEFVKKKIWGLLEDSVRMRVVADVPVGLFLSGGLDSATLVHLTKKHMSNINTYTLGFEGDKIGDERKAARDVAKKYNTNHTEILLGIKDLNLLPKVIYHLDEPMSDPAAFATYVLSQRASKDVKVILSGEGGDELFGGYSQYAMFANMLKIRGLPQPTLDLLAYGFAKTPKALLNKVYKYSSSTGKEMNKRMTNFMTNVKKKPAKSYLEIVSIFNERERRALFDESKIAVNKNEELFAPFLNVKRPVCSTSTFDMHTYLVEDLLMKPDKTGMASSIEIRVPFLDHRLVDLSRELSEKQFISGMKGKVIFREVINEHLDPKITQRKKQTFQLPLHVWLTSDIQPRVRELIDELANSLKLNKRFIDHCFETMDASPLYRGRQIWNLLVLSIWYKLYIEGVHHSKIKLI